MKRKFQVKYSLRAVIGIEVVAETMERAIEIADKRRGKNLFANGIESLDERSALAGCDNLHEWKVTE